MENKKVNIQLESFILENKEEEGLILIVQCKHGDEYCRADAKISRKEASSNKIRTFLERDLMESILVKLMSLDDFNPWK